MKFFNTILLFTYLCFTIDCACCQTVKPVKQVCVLKGSVKNFRDTAWSFSYTGFFKNQIINVPVAGDGSFSKSITVDHVNDVYLYLNNDAIISFVAPGDTLTLNWDEKDFNNTFKIQANKTGRQQEIDAMFELHKRYFLPLIEFLKKPRSTSLTDSTTYLQVNGMFGQQVKTLLKYQNTQNWEKIYNDVYLQDKQLLFDMLSNTNKSKYKLVLDRSTNDSLKKRLYKELDYIDNTLDERLFAESVNYRNYITSTLRYNPFTSRTYSSAFKTELQPNYTMQEYYKGMSQLYTSPKIRDWYITNSILHGFELYDFKQVEQAYLKFLPEIVSPSFKEELINGYNAARSLKPGRPAPAFSLKDDHGRKVTLSSFLGKTVFIDFWGVGCGPCIYDIQTYSTKFHKKYESKNVVFLNICVDVDVAEWKKSLTSMPMQGINLIAEGWTNNPVCKAYNVNGIPHYTIIDAKGNIVSNNAPRMEDLLNSNGIKNELDLALNTK